MSLTPLETEQLFTLLAKAGLTLSAFPKAIEQPRDLSARFEPMTFVDGGNKYIFRSKIQFQLWRALFEAGRRLTFNEILSRVPAWQNYASEAAIGQMVESVKSFWRSKKRNRPDLADGITLSAGTVGYAEIVKPLSDRCSTVRARR